MNNHPMRRENVIPKVRKLSVITVKVWDIMLMIVLVPKMPKSLCNQQRVILILKRVLPQLLKMQGKISMTY